MTISANERWYPGYENGTPVKGVIGRFDFMEIEFQARNEKGEAIGEPVLKKVPAYIEKTTMSPDFVEQKLPLDPIQRKAVIDRFPQAWAAFQGEHVEDIGTPLDREFKGMTVGGQERQRYEMVGISAWEQLADLSDLGCDQLGFGTKKRRNDVMRALGRTPPGEVPAISLSFGMTAKDALMAMPGGDKLVAELEKKIAEHNGDGGTVMRSSANAAPDLNHPTVQAAIEAAAKAAAEAAIAQMQAAGGPKVKRGGWPRGKSRKGVVAAEPETPMAEADAA